jgi:hypothetical protein
MKFKKITGKIIGLGLISTLFFTGCQIPSSEQNNSNLSQPTQENNANSDQTVDISGDVETLKTYFNNFKTKNTEFNQNLKQIVTREVEAQTVDFKGINQASTEFYDSLKKLKNILDESTVKNEDILQQSLTEIETLLASINKVIKPLDNGLDKTNVTEVQRYINFFPRRGISAQYYGVFGTTTQEEIDLFLRQKFITIEQYLQEIEEIINMETIEVNPDNIDPINNTDNTEVKSINSLGELAQENQNLKTEITTFSNQIKKSIFIVIVIGFIVIAIVLIAIIAIFYKLYQMEIVNNTNVKQNIKQNPSPSNQNPEYQLKFQKYDQEISRINQYMEQIDRVLIQQINRMNQQIINLEKNKQVNNNINHTNQPVTTLSQSVNNPLVNTINTNPVSSNNNNSLTITSPEDLLSIYHNNPNFLLSKAIPISESLNTMNKRREGKDIIPIFEENRRGDYWLISLSDNNYLFPRPDFKINEFSYKSLIVSFICHNDNLTLTKFKVIKPAQLIKTIQGWELKQTGEINFY